MSKEIFKLESLGRGFYRVKYLGKSFYFHVFLCRKNKQSIDEEIADLGLDAAVHALIPENSIVSINQFVQGVLHYYIYERTYTRIRNKGLLLLMFILGLKQLKDVISKINADFADSDNYYLVVVGNRKVSAPDRCVDADLVFDLNNDDYEILAKNVQSVLEML